MDLGDLDAAATLRLAGETLRRQREADAKAFQIAVHWADLNAGVQKRKVNGWVENAVQLGGDGTPFLMEFAPAELAIELELHPLGARALMADGLDLRHRFPHFWTLTVDELAVPSWVARKVMRMTRHLNHATALVIDERIAGTGDAATLSPSRLLDLVEALVIAADNKEADEKRKTALGRRFVNISNHKSDPGTTGIYGCLDDEGAQLLEATISRLAKALADAGDKDPVDVRRAKALVLLGNPALALKTLLGPSPESEPEADLAKVLATIDPAKLIPTAVVYVHLTDATLFDNEGVARWEGVGPITRACLLELLGHRNVVVKPVHLPAEQRAADSYEYTGSLREAVLLLRPRDVYPYAVGATRHVDIDHTEDYDDTGPPGQTGVGNAGPMVRHHHRIKTFGRIAVRQPKLGSYIWRTRYRQYRFTDATGTRHVPSHLGDVIFGSEKSMAKLALLAVEHSR